LRTLRSSLATFFAGLGGLLGKAAHLTPAYTANDDRIKTIISDKTNKRFIN